MIFRRCFVQEDNRHPVACYSRAAPSMQHPEAPQLSSAPSKAYGGRDIALSSLSTPRRCHMPRTRMARTPRVALVVMSIFIRRQQWQPAPMWVPAAVGHEEDLIRLEETETASSSVNDLVFSFASCSIGAREGICSTVASPLIIEA